MVKKWRILCVLAITASLLAGLRVTACAIGVGESGHEVRKIQEKLGQLGYYSGKNDGIFSPALSRSLKEYQASRGLPAGGDADSTTIAALFDHGSNPENNLQRLLALYISVKCAGKPYWEQLSCGQELLAKLRDPAAPSCLASLVLEEVKATKLLKVAVDNGASQASWECLYLQSFGIF